MLQFVNGFSISTNEQNNNLVIHFIQNEPTIPELNGSNTPEVISHHVASIVMEAECSKEFIEIISNIKNNSL